MIIEILNIIISLQTVTSNKLTTIQTRNVAEQEFLYDSPPRTFSSKREMLYDISPMWERPISLETFVWTTNTARFQILKSYDLMSSYFSATPSFKSFLKNYAFFRCHACAYVTVTGSINHQGILLVGATPASELVWDSNLKGEDVINMLLTGPHSLLGANEASSTCVEIPFYVASDFITMEANDGSEPSIPDLYSQSRNPYSKLVVMCMNPLVAGGSGSTTLTVQVVIKINKLEVYVQTPSSPTYVSLAAESFLGQVTTATFDKASDFLKTTSSDFIDALRATVRQYTGLHNPNQPTLTDAMFMSTRNRANVVDKPTFYEKMDPYYDFTRVTKDTIFHTKQDEMDMNFILSKPQYLGTFQVSTTDPVGKVLWIRPISPWQGGSHGGTALTNNIERLYYLTQAWSGDMELVIQSSMTNKQNVKLMVSKIYGLDRRIITQYPDYTTAKSGITSIIEFSGGNQQQEVTLDFLSRNQILYNTIDPVANSLLHGMYYIYVNQPLIVADDAPLTVEFNVYMRCKPGFRYYGYGMRPGYSTYKPKLNTYVPLVPPALVAESATQPVMNAPSDGAPLLNRDENLTQVQQVIERMYPIENLRDLVRRVQHTGRFTALVDSNGLFTLCLPVAALMGLFPTTLVNQSANQHLMKMYLGVNGGCRLKIRSFDSSNHMLQYYPPTIVSQYATGMVAPTIPLTANVLEYTNSAYINVNVGNIIGAPILEMPTAWTADIRAGETGSVMDIHIPHTTIYHWWGGLGWAGDPFPIDAYPTLMNNMGYLIITGIGQPNSIADFECFMGLDDEARLGFHTQCPVLTLPIRKTVAVPLNDTYAIPELAPSGANPFPIKYAKPTSLYYSTLTTAFETVLTP